LAQSSKDSESFNALYRGDWQGRYKSQSEADFAFCCKLAFWSGRNEAQMDRLFRKSSLICEKWDERHSADGATYGQRTIRNACQRTTQVYKPAQKKESEIFVHNGAYFRGKGDKFYQITNFVIEPIEMIVAEDEAQLTCDLITTRGERFRQTFLSNDFANVQKLQNVLTKRTIALSFLGGDGDLGLFNTNIYDMDWTKKRGVKALGIYPHGGALVFVDTKGAVGVGGAVVSDVVQLEKYKGLESDILSSPFIDRTGLSALGKQILSYNVPSRTVPILAWLAGAFIKPHLRRGGVKFPHLFLIGEPGSGKSSSLERIVLPIFGKTRLTASPQVTTFTLPKAQAHQNQ